MCDQSNSRIMCTCVKPIRNIVMCTGGVANEKKIVKLGGGGGGGGYKPVSHCTFSVLYAADEGLRAETSCIQSLNNLLHIAHKLFANISKHNT